jgi:nucleoside-diphosphate-sugar epimerase
MNGAKARVVLVTGASGFIGGHIAGRLARVAGLDVRCASRSGRALVENTTACRLDVLDRASLDAACAGADAVVHCAVGDRATTITGTANVLRAAQHAGVRRAVHLSSVSVYGSANLCLPESAPSVAADGRGYPHWKAAAEALCREIPSGQGRLQVVMLRPTIVYGAGSRLWVELMVRRILSGRWGTFGAAGEGFCNLVHAQDVADAALAALTADAAGEAFNINGPSLMTWNTWFTQLAALIGAPELAERPLAVWRRRSLAALPGKALVRLFPSARPWLEQTLLGAPAASELALFAQKATYPTDKALALLGWQPRMSLADGLADSLRWLREAGHVSAKHEAAMSSATSV